MPELPEVETTRRGLAPHLEGRRVLGVTLRRKDLRWPIPREIETLLPQQTITQSGSGYRMRVTPEEDEPPALPKSHDFR